MGGVLVAITLVELMPFRRKIAVFSLGVFTHVTTRLLAVNYSDSRGNK
jgi:hypothetical protein